MDEKGIEGFWRVRYAMKQEPPFVSEEGFSDEEGWFRLFDGKLEGRDRWGFEYLGFYSLDGSHLSISVISSPFEEGATSIIDDTHRRFHMEFAGDFNSPNYVSMIGHEVGKEQLELVINCQRESDKFGAEEAGT